MTPPHPFRRTGARRRLALVAAAGTLAGTALLGASTAGASTSTASTATARTAATAHPDATSRRLAALVGTDRVPGVLASVSTRGGEVRNYTAGVGNLATGAKVPTDGYVRIASNTKTYTAVVVLQLVGEGLVDLDAPVETYLPGLVRHNGNDGRRITVRQLLQQTSGLPDYDDDLPTPLSRAARTYQQPRTLLDHALSHRSHFAPGTTWEYSNTNYLLAGLVVEQVTGRPINEQITDRILRPLHLTRTYWPATGNLRIRAPHPQGYFAAAPGDPWQDITAFEPSIGWAAGELIATPSDVLAFYQAVVGGKLLQPAQQREMETTVAAPGFEPTGRWRYGLGLAKKTLSCGVTAWGHGGDIPGFESRDLVTEDGRGAVVVTTALPTTYAPLNHLNAAVEATVCAS
ncbi:D-alanyl-D-alanine carboxypeptidase [Motilibacter peucedani]|uniref:D-alanyl-D-alanine carboxypeptidase n=1 Tax=Motilibacter peucedani TaxID=598650 RepID=A0A420XMY5_9ACTN|nr:serine hydrolase domain-containing protein [Motilibacter peucedani]RKS72635.1 D-alanyl-D-alanine carboxypeptidase [Motilibacter peucedani]